MNRLAAGFVLLLAACSGPQSRELDARGAFEGWVAANVAGDAEKSFGMLSASYKSEWLYQLLEENDGRARDWRGALTGSARTDLDLWLLYSRKTRQDRAEVLPETVLRHPSLVSLYRQHFVDQFDRVKAEFSGMSIVNVYSDTTGATVTVRNVRGGTELFAMTVEMGGWKIHNHRGPLRQSTR
jgi:hypothetical protein